MNRSKYGKDSCGIAFVKASCPKGIDPADIILFKLVTITDYFYSYTGTKIVKK